MNSRERAAFTGCSSDYVRISKGKARNPCEFGVKVSLVVTHKQGLMVGARSFPGNPCAAHVLSAQLEQTSNLLQDLGRSPKQGTVDLGCRGVEAHNQGVQIIHRGKYNSVTDHEKRMLKRRRAIEPLIGHTKSDHWMRRRLSRRAATAKSSGGAHFDSELICGARAT